MIIAYDLGTGGLKATLHGDDLALQQAVFLPYETLYPAPGWHEQRPGDWWQAVCIATRRLLEAGGVAPCSVEAVALSGHSIVPVLLDAGGGLLNELAPIWSDTRAASEAAEFFQCIPWQDWYLATGNGDPAETYTVMKLLWYKNHHPDLWKRVAAILGSKDYINYRLTGAIASDASYASGSGVFDLSAGRWRGDFLNAAGIPAALLPPLRPAHALVGRVGREAAVECGLAEGTPVACGGVDNACMALGAVGVGEGRAYTSLGSSAWMAVTSRTPVLDVESRPFIFAHVEPGYYTSGVSIFAAGSAYRWASETLCADLPASGARYAAMDALAAAVPPGAGGVLFNPTLAGGSSQEPSPHLAGAFMGLTLGTTRAAMLRAVLEGVALSLNEYCLEALRRCAPVAPSMLLCGGGGNSPLWSHIFADVFGLTVLHTAAGQNAASIGAAAIAARSVGLIDTYAHLDGMFPPTAHFAPNAENHALYTQLGAVFKSWTDTLAGLSRQAAAISSQPK